MASRYDAGGPQAEFEPGSRGRVLRNQLGIRRVRDMVSPLAKRAKPEYFVAIQAAMGDNYKPLETLFGKVIRKTLSSFAAKP